MSLETISAYKTEFQSRFEEFLKPNNDEGKRILNFLQRLQRQLNITDVEPMDILGEVYLAGIKEIEEKGGRIREPEKWIKAVGRYKILDVVGKEKKNRELREKNDYQVKRNGYDPFTPLLLCEESSELQIALSQLPSEDRRLLELYYLEGKSYKEIQSFFSENSNPLQESALRKRCSRAVIKLRKIMLKAENTA